MLGTAAPACCAKAAVAKRQQENRDWLRSVLTDALGPRERAVATERLAEATTDAERTMFRTLLTLLGEG